MKRLHIDRLDLELRGIAPATAEAAARQLGPALARALSQRTVTASSGRAIDAGRVALDHAPDASTLAGRVARQIAQTTSRDTRASGVGRKK